MDEKDKEIVKMLQSGFPLTPKPFQVLGDKLWIDEMTVISRLARLSQKGIIRYFGAFFNSEKLGYHGVLAAIDAPEERIEEIASVVNEFPQVTHNYQRDGHPNLWFTVIAKSEAELKKVLKEIEEKARIDKIWLFFSKKQFKVRSDMG